MLELRVAVSGDMSQLKTVTPFSIDAILHKGKEANDSPPSVQSADSIRDGGIRFKFEPRLAALASPPPPALCSPFFLTPLMAHPPTFTFPPSTPIQPSGAPTVCGRVPLSIAACRDPRVLPYPLASPSPPYITIRKAVKGDDSPLSSPVDTAGECRSRKKKKRTAFSSQQLKKLEEKFNQQKYLSKIDRCELAANLGLSERHVKTWYQNRRTKWKKECCESDWSKQRESAAAIMYMQHIEMNGGCKKSGSSDSEDDIEC